MNVVGDASNDCCRTLGIIQDRGQITVGARLKIGFAEERSPLFSREDKMQKDKRLCHVYITLYCNVIVTHFQRLFIFYIRFLGLRSRLLV